MKSKQNKAEINYSGLSDFINSVGDENVFYIDFETSMSPIPFIRNTKPYQHICFQYCCIKEDNELLTKTEFLAEPGYDPRLIFLKSFLKSTEGDGKIIVYNIDFEKARLEELLVTFPEYTEKIENRINRLIDLMEPFKNKTYKHPDFNNKYSLKTIVPIICPELSYDYLEIQDGLAAQNAWMSMHKLSSVEQIIRRNELLRYCFNDVITMVKILHHLKMISKNHQNKKSTKYS